MQRLSKTTKRFKSGFKKIPGFVHLMRLCKFIVIPAYRSEWLLLRTKPDNLFQSCALTVFDRHPRIFSYIREYVPDVATTRILSFGCSTGEEVFTLRRYFPLAEIVGIDINPYNIAVCHKKLQRCGDARIRFVLAETPEAEQEASYDAIFCMSVLRNGQLATYPQTCEQLIRFADFEKIVNGFCRCLIPGGYLILRHCNFRFSDTTAATGFDVVGSHNALTPRADTPLYGPDNKWLRGKVYNEVIFRKREILDKS